MSKEKIIEEIARDFNKGMCSDREVVESCAECVGASEHCVLYKIATRIYNAGYRKQEWISVDERLPDEAVRVLVWLREPSAILRFLQFDTDRIVDGRWVRWNNHITHWMPLPEPPKMKGGAE